jgi:hypothetical protein
MRLSSRLQAGIKSWTECLKGSRSSKHIDDTDTTSMAAHKPGGDPDIQVSSQLYFFPCFLFFFVSIFLSIFSFSPLL